MPKGFCTTLATQRRGVGRGSIRIAFALALSPGNPSVSELVNRSNLSNITIAPAQRVEDGDSNFPSPSALTRLTFVPVMNSLFCLGNLLFENNRLHIWGALYECEAGIITYGDIVGTKPSYSLTHIFIVFACGGNN